jgi:hypothetical protein
VIYVSDSDVSDVPSEVVPWCLVFSTGVRTFWVDIEVVDDPEGIWVVWGIENL